MEHYLYYDYGFNSNYMDKIKMIKDANFDGVILFYEDGLDEIISEIYRAGLKIESMHLPFDGCNEIWKNTIAGDEYVDLLIKAIKASSRFKINSVVIHISSKNDPPMFNQLGLNRINKILMVAEEYQVYVALENLRRLDYLDYVFNNIESKYLKFCFDSGHANAFTKNIESFEWAKYQDKMICLHLHDNDGINDLHLIPFEGNIDWKLLAKNLKNSGYQGPLTCESIVKNPTVIEEAEYLKKVKKSLEQIEELYNL